jgi:hypothetical protein
LALTATLGICLSAAFAGPVVPKAREKVETPLAKSYLTRVVEGDVLALNDMETDVMKKGFTSVVLTGISQQLKAAHFEQIPKAEIRTGILGSFDVIYIPCKTSDKQFDAKIVFDAKYKVAGFFLIKPGTD